MDHQVHPNAICESPRIGRGTRVWAFVHVLPGAVIGEDCNLCDHVFVENDVVLGDRVTVKCGVQLWDGLRLEDDVFVGPNATFTNDLHPRSKVRPEHFAVTTVKRGASIGANATILPGLTIGAGAMVGAGAVVTRSVPPNAVVTGNPAAIVGYVDTRTPAGGRAAGAAPAGEAGQSVVRGVLRQRLTFVEDIRGNLAVGEFGKHVPFRPARFFLVHGVPSREVRGEHAHRECEQFLVCVKGSCSLLVDDGTHREEMVLDGPSLGVYVPPMVWAVQYRHTPDAVLLVFASAPYDPADYIRDYDEFLAAL